MNDAQATNGTRRTSGLAIASLILSCGTVILGPFGCIPGIACGHLARSECRKNPSVGGDGIALAGLIVGYVFLVFLIVGVLLYLCFVPRWVIMPPP